MMNIVILMAGRGQRFQSCGYASPKMLLAASDGQPMLWYAVRGLHHLPQPKRWIFIVLSEHLIHHSLLSRIAEIAIDEPLAVVSLDGLRNGPLMSALASKGVVPSDEPVIFHNCDTYIQCDVELLHDLLTRDSIDGVIPVFNSQSRSLSYAKVNEAGVVIEMTEKVPVPPYLASSGTYAFARAATFFDIVDRIGDQDGELFFSTLYKPLFESGYQTVPLKLQNAISMGTPKEFMEFNKRLQDQSTTDHAGAI